VVPYSGSVAQFLLNKDYVQQGYVFSEPLIVRRRGGHARVLMLSDLDFNPYTSVLFTSEAVLREQPDVARRMVAASARGWAKYLASPHPTNQKIGEANREIDLDILSAGGESIRPLVLGEVTQKEGIGAMSLARWQTLANQLYESGQLKTPLADVQKAFTTELLAARTTPDDEAK